MVATDPRPARGIREKTGYILALPLFLLVLFAIELPGLSIEGHRVLAVAAMMALLWTTEAIPIPVTALMPLVLFPVLNVSAFGKVAQSYAHSNVFLFMGGFFIAIAMQKWHLHRRIALHLILRIGGSPGRLVLGFMVATAFLSMWISNTATALMMFPIGLAIVVHLEEKNRAEKHAIMRFRVALMLAIAYSASVGGIGTLIGTPPNIVFSSSVAALYPQAPPIGFAQWLIPGLLLVMIFLPVIWLILTRLMFPMQDNLAGGGRAIIREEINKLGPMTREERLVSAVFVLTALAWITRGDLLLGNMFIEGWASRLGLASTVIDATVAMGAAVVLFLLPAGSNTAHFLLEWRDADKIPWGILLLFGGGIALAAGFKTSGLAEWIGGQLHLFASVPVPVMILLICLTLTFLTEVTSNTATSTLFMPILASTATGIGVHPFLLMIPATISASCAFMLPVATPPNAIIFGSGYISIPDMVKTGFLLNLAGVVLVTLITWYVVIPVFGITAGIPAWAR